VIATPFYADGDHLAVDMPGARALFTTRRGGFSTGPFKSLNLGRWTEDRPADVERNRARLTESLGLRLAYGRQVHGAVVHTVGDFDANGTPPEADGQATALPGVAPMVLVADCLPIAVAGPGAVAMLHAGWRGLAKGVIEEGIRAVRELAGDGETHLVAAIGPGAGPCCYEVGEEVHAAFASTGGSARRGANLDLKAIARRRLLDAGVDAVHDVALCTICEEALFFSHRRDHGVTGRQAGLVWLS
jgi:YfiH family protein